MKAYSMSADAGYLFYSVCKLFDLDTEQQREALLELMSQKGFMTSVVETNMTKENYVEHLSKNFKVLKVEPKND